MKQIRRKVRIDHTLKPVVRHVVYLKVRGKYRKAGEFDTYEDARSYTKRLFEVIKKRLELRRVYK